MEAIKAEIARKRKQLEDAQLVDSNKKYFKRGDLISKHEEEYLKKHMPQNLPSSSSTANATQEDNGGGVVEPDIKRSIEEFPKLSRREVIRRLRERGEPITLFGEDESEAFKRLRKLEILEPEVNRGLRNDLQAALEQVDQAYLEEILKTRKTETGEIDRKKFGDVQVQEDDFSYDEIVAKAKSVLTGTKDLEAHSKMLLQWFRFLLKVWGHNLNARPEEEKLSTRGKLASATYTQTVEYMRPLLRKLKSNTLVDDLLECLVEIVLHMLDKEYIKANDAYLEMAIGNAPWPIGVTMVGIHARTGREKIFSKNVAHVMNDETQRKYIQGLKRLMTKCQQFFATSPSKSVEYAPESTF